MQIVVLVLKIQAAQVITVLLDIVLFVQQAVVRKEILFIVIQAMVYVQPVLINVQVVRNAHLIHVF
jgi:hypothetical protein